MSSDMEDQKDDQAVVKSNLMRGMKIRDEFLCPITYELMREPVVASDGHTYEKNAIEKWLKTNHTSPRSGEPMESLIIPNINLKKLIQDIINEGGAGFYTSDISNKDRIFELCPEKVLILNCLGPPESDWNQQSFQVTKFGCVGGRRHNVEDSANLREIVLFKDITVSRRHFEITQCSEPAGKNKNFYIRDLGSAGGTYIRIKYGDKKQLHPGMIILLGKHQFTVSSIDDMGGHDLVDTRKSFNATTGAVSTRKSVFNSNVILSIVENAERIIADFSRGEGGTQDTEEKRQKEELSARLKSLTAELSHLQMMEEPSVSPISLPIPDTPHMNGRGESKRVFESKEAFHSRVFDATLHQHNQSDLLELPEAKDPSGAEGEHEERRDTFMAADSKTLDHALNGTGAKAKGTSHFLQRRCTLTCCAPDGSPLQGNNYVIGAEGAMMGRKQSNAIPLYLKVADPVTGEERIANVDTAISSEHARVEFDESTGNFYISDGTPTKASTNGTWFRLSGPHQESPPHVLVGGAEVLIGTVRFIVKESMTICERKVVDEK